MPNATYKEIIESLSIYGALGGVGGVAMYLNQVRKGKPFKITMFAINIFVAGWIGIVIKDFIPASMGDIQFSIVSLSGFLAFPILDYIEEKGIPLIFKKVLGVKE